MPNPIKFQSILTQFLGVALILAMTTGCEKKKEAAVSEASAPAAPIDLGVSLNTDTSVTLTWTDVATDELLYEVQNCEGAGCEDFADVANSPRAADSSAIEVSNLSQATPYRFRVRSRNSAGSSEWLSTEEVLTDPTAVLPPTSFTITNRTDVSVQISWIDNADNESSYYVESCRGFNCTNFQAVSGSPFATGTGTVTVLGLIPSENYRFRVKALNTVTESAFLTSGNVKMAPAAPATFAIGAISENSISFSWADYATDEDAYLVERCVGSGCSSFSSVSGSPLSANVASHTENGLAENTTYRFRVRASNSNGQSNYLVGSYVTTLLAAPSSLNLTEKTDTSLRLAWVDKSFSETGYRVERCSGVACSSFAVIASLPANSSSYVDSGLTPSSAYRYRVRAVSVGQNSVYTTTGDVTTGPLAPTGLSLGSVTYDSISFSWTDNAPDETAYEIERCEGASCNTYASLTNALPVGTTGYTDNTVSGNTTYRYRIRALSAAGGSAYLTSGNITTLVAPTPALSCDVVNRSIVDFGSKSAGSLATSSRGLFTDIRYIPTGVVSASSTTTGQANGNIPVLSANMGVAYLDSSSQSIKYSYWMGGSFKTEVVAGDVAANVTLVKLVYLSNSPHAGKPLIFWTNGAANSGQIMMAARDTASLVSEGTWSVRAIDAGGGATNRALQVSVNPLDQVALVYQAATGPRIRFAYCSSACHDSANYISMISGDRVDTASVASQLRLGISWCQHASGAYSPGVSYGVSATSFTYATCPNFSANPSSCLVAASWVKSTTPITVGAGSGLVSDVYLDPSILRDTPRIAVKDNTAGIRTYTLPSCDSFSAGTSYTGPGATIVGSTAAATANSWLKILKHADYATPSNERFQLIYNDGITDMRWAASNGTHNFGGAWLSSATSASSIHNNSSLLSAAGTTTMGADINPVTGQIVAAYGTAIAGSFNLALGVVDGYLPPANPTILANNTFLRFSIETNGSIQLNATQYKNVAIAATSDNRPAVAWVDFSSGVYTTGRLKYALRNSAEASGGSWNPVQVPAAPGVGVPGPLYPSLAFDNNDRPWISYWDQTLLHFVLVTNTHRDGSGTWTSYLFPLSGAINYGAPLAQPASNSTALVMYRQGGVSYPVMIVLNNSASVTTRAVRAARFDPATGKWSTPVNIDSVVPAAGANFLTADANASGAIVVSYQVLGAGVARVRYSASTDGGTTWPTNGGTPYSVSDINQGEGASVRINPATGLPSIAYYDRANNRLYHANCTQQCLGSGTPTFVGTSAPTLTGLGISGLTGIGNVSLLDASLSFAANGDAHILYNSGHLDMGSLKLIDNVGGSMPSNVATTVVAGANGTYNSAATAATNGGIPWGQQSIRLKNGVLATAYITPGNWLGVATCGD